MGKGEKDHRPHKAWLETHITQQAVWAPTEGSEDEECDLLHPHQMVGLAWRDRRPKATQHEAVQNWHHWEEVIKRQGRILLESPQAFTSLISHKTWCFWKRSRYWPVWGRWRSQERGSALVSACGKSLLDSGEMKLRVEWEELKKFK